jgi:hypothetical protein
MDMMAYWGRPHNMPWYIAPTTPDTVLSALLFRAMPSPRVILFSARGSPFNWEISMEV